MDDFILSIGLFLLAGLLGLRAAFALLGALFFNKGDQSIAKRKFYIFFGSLFLGLGVFVAWMKIAVSL